jgi:predicted O-methyltransferase YrrM
MIKDGFWEYFGSINYTKETVRKLLQESKDVVDYERGVLRNGRYWQISKDEVRAIYCIIREKRPRVVIETGMGSGVSTTTILSAMKGTGRLVSIDPAIPYGKGDREVGFLIPENLKKNLEFVKGTSAEKLPPLLKSLEKVDAFFHDSDHSYENVSFELNAVFPKMEDNPLILVDNYDWTKAAEDFAKDRGLRLRNVADDLALLTK